MRKFGLLKEGALGCRLQSVQGSMCGGLGRLHWLEVRACGRDADCQAKAHCYS